MEKALLFCPYPEEASVLIFILQQAGFSAFQIRKLEHNFDESLQIQCHFALMVLPQTQSDSLDENLLAFIKRLTNILKIPTLVLCSHLSEDLHVALLDSGVEGILSKPYSIRVVQAYIRNIQRRLAGLPSYVSPTLSHGGITLEPARRVAYVNGQEPQRLTQLEFRLLYILMSHIGQIIPIEDIVEQVWGYNEGGGRTLVRGVIQRLRAKLEPDPRHPRYILTESGVGYYFKHFDMPETRSSQ